MRIERDEATSRVRLWLEDYADLLTCRRLPEWRMVGPRVAETAEAHLDQIGLAPESERIDYTPAPFLFDYQAWIVGRAIERQRFAVFATTGLGKTAVQLDWARAVQEHTGGRVLIVAPLAICPQTIEESEHFYEGKLPVADLRERADLSEWLRHGSGIGITNYEKLDNTTDPLPVDGFVLDESSCLKQSMGARRTALIAAGKGIRWKLACSATPAPNDRVEYGEHAYFLDVVRSTREFLAAFFINRDGNWELKRHGHSAFYRHLASWSVFMVDPRAFRFEGHQADLPPLDVTYPHVPATEEQTDEARLYESGDPSLFGASAGGITSRTKLMQVANGFLLDGKNVKRFPSDKPEFVAQLANETHGDEQVIVWVNFDEEGSALARLIPDAVELSGKTRRDVRDATIEDFRHGHGPRVLVLKASMFGHGLNLQACRVQVFSSLSDSWERWFQAVRRSWRFGQDKPVCIYVPLTPFDEAMCQNVLNKQATYEEDAKRAEAEFVRVLRPADTTERRVFNTVPQAEIDRTEGERFTLIHGDCVAHMPTMPEHSMDFSIFSPPFANLFTYSSEAADMGNVRGDEEYRLQWEFFVEELLRVMKPGRNVAVHCMDVIRFAGQHGHRHTYDYPSDLRAGMEKAGFLYRARVAIDKDPQVQATRTKDANLLFVTLKRNALDSHPQASECVLLFTAPGEPEVPVHAMEISNREWIEWAHHVWYGIRATDVLNTALGKEHEDEKHICPLQLGLIERCVRLWTNPGEVVFSPFAGIGSEGWEAIRLGRRYYGVELKRSYYDTAARNLATMEQNMQATLFSSAEADREEAIT